MKSKILRIHLSMEINPNPNKKSRYQSQYEINPIKKSMSRLRLHQLVLDTLSVVP